MANRRLILKGLGGAVLAATPVTAAVSAQSRERVVMTKSYVVNLTDDAFGAREPLTGEELGLIREPERPFDGNSIGVLHGDRRIGYLPGNQSKMLAPLVDAGFDIEARVVGVKHQPRPSVELEVSIRRA